MAAPTGVENQPRITLPSRGAVSLGCGVYIMPLHELGGRDAQIPARPTLRFAFASATLPGRRGTTMWTPITIPRTSRLYEPLNGALTSLSMQSEAQAAREGRPLTQNDHTVLAARYYPNTVGFAPLAFADAAFANAELPEITLQAGPPVEQPAGPGQWLHTFAPFNRRVWSGAFTVFYESQKPFLNGMGRQREWPAIFRFAWMVRNACAHNGQVHFNDRAEPPVNWRECSVGPGQQGESLLFELLSPGDVPGLMLELDAELTEWGAP